MTNLIITPSNTHPSQCKSAWLASSVVLKRMSLNRFCHLNLIWNFCLYINTMYLYLRYAKYIVQHVQNYRIQIIILNTTQLSVREINFKSMTLIISLWFCSICNQNNKIGWPNFYNNCFPFSLQCYLIWLF